MRPRLLLCTLVVGLPLILGGGPSVHAQYYGYAPNAPYPYPYPQQQQRRDRRAYPPGYYPGKLVQPAPQPGFSFRRLFGVQEAPPPAAARPVVRPRRPVAPRSTIVRQEKPKADPTTQVIVFGDALAEFAGQGLGELFSDSEDIAVIRKAKAHGGLVEMGGADWTKAIDEALGTGKKTNVAVVMLGSEDRQPLKQDAESYEALTDKWRDLYRGRVDAAMRAFGERNLPVVWIGLPPARNAKTSEEFLAMNEIYKESVLRNGGTYVDVWPGFVDEDNRYTMTGPDVEGQPAKLRTNDGDFFTKAGSRKLAHFAHTEIKRLIEAELPPIVTVPPVDAAPAPDSLEAALPELTDDVAPVSLPTKPLIGPVLPLSQPVVAPGGTLVTGAPKLNGDQAYWLRRALRNGVAPVSRPGRADDFRWPPS